MHYFVFASTLKDMLQTKRVLPWVALGLALFGVALFWTKVSGNAGAGQYGVISRIIVYRVVALAAAMFTTMVISQEIEQKTIVYLVTRTVPRGVIMWSRGLAAASAVALMSWIAVFGVGVAIFGLNAFTRDMVWMDLVITLLGALAYSSLFIFITLIMNRAMLLILAFAFVWESFVPNFKGDLYLMSINTYMSALATHPTSAVPSGVAGQVDVTGVASWVAWVVLLGIFVGFTALNAFWFRRFEYLPREDAE